MSPSTSEYRVLVADDDVGSRDSLSLLLSAEGFDTVPVDCGEQAVKCILELTRRSSPTATTSQWNDSRLDFLVLDYNMPDLTGVEVLRAIRSQLIMVPAIVVTGEFSVDLERTVLRAGGFALVPKPVQLNLFRSLVRDLIRKKLKD